MVMGVSWGFGTIILPNYPTDISFCNLLKFRALKARADMGEGKLGQLPLHDFWGGLRVHLSRKMRPLPLHELL